jgi:phage protein D
MSEDYTSAPGLKTYAPSIEIKLMDEKKKHLKDIPQGDVISLKIDEDLEGPGMFMISLSDALDLITKKPRWSTDKDIKPENMVKTTIGYASDVKKKRLSVVGRISSSRPEKGNENGGILKLRGYDLAYDLRKKDTEGIICNDKKYSEIVTELAGKSNLKTDKIETSPLTYENVTRYPGESDFDFLKRMSEEIGFEAFVQDESLHFHKPKDNLKGKITLRKNWDILNFSPSINTAAWVNEVIVNSWDMKKKETISEKVKVEEIKSGVGNEKLIATTKNLKNKITLGNRVLRSAEEAKNVAIVELKRRNQNFIKAELKCVGYPELRPGKTVNIENVEKEFNGVYYIEQAIHEIGENGYFTSLSLRGCL